DEGDEVGAAERPAAREDDAAKIAVRGQVLDPDGKPVVGAKLYVPRLKTAKPRSEADVVVEAAGATDADGRFSLTLSGVNYVIAHAPGFGVDWVNLREHKLPGAVAIRLVKDVPIT